MKRFSIQAAQGDIHLRMVDQIPPGCVRRELPRRRRVVVAHSETGHHHTVPSFVEVWDPPGDPMTCYLRSDRAYALQHERPFDRHDAIEIPIGVVRIRRQRERTSTPQGWRRVED